MDNLSKRWKIFGSLVLDPWTLLIVMFVAMLILPSKGETNTTVVSLVTVLLSLASGVVGGRITKQWLELTEKGVLVTRGKSAIRSLKLILKNIATLERRVSVYLSRLAASQDHDQLVTTYFEEVIEKCNTLEEDVVNSIENWVDIVPEASEAKTQIGVISDLKQDIAAKEALLHHRQTELDEAKEWTTEATQALETEIISLQEDREQLYLLLEAERNKLSTSILSTVLPLNRYSASGGVTFRVSTPPEESNILIITDESDAELNQED